MASEPIPLSVVIATTHGWPTVRGCLDRLRDQASAASSEIIVADGDGCAFPDQPAPPVIWLRAPGSSVFELRARGIAIARGAVIAMTEDHCGVASDWCARILAAHAENPGAGAVAGAIVNGSTTRLMDWANFLATFASFLPPIDSSSLERTATPANISYKRTALPSEPPDPGWLELSLNPTLQGRGELVFDDRIRVAHVQSHGTLGTAKMHFHNGRSCAGLRRPDTRRWWRRIQLVRSIRLLAMLLAQTSRALVRRPPYWRVGLASAPLIGLLHACHTAGHVVGLVAGPGSSPWRLD